MVKQVMTLDECRKLIGEVHLILYRPVKVEPLENSNNFQSDKLRDLEQYKLTDLSVDQITYDLYRVAFDD